jgi:hypothetical protein
VPRAWHEQYQFLQMAGQVWRYGRIIDGRMKELEAENARLKKMYADVQLQNDVIKEAMAKKW